MQTITDTVNEDGSVTRTITDTIVQKLTAQQYQAIQAGKQAQIVAIQADIDAMTPNIATVQANVAKVAKPIQAIK